MNYNPPQQYLQGYTEFYKLKFKVTPDVLIPRPETELLVWEVLNFLKTTNLPTGRQDSKPTTILDIGTGSGNIAISLAKNLPSHFLTDKIKIIATDISAKALKIARQNAKLHGVTDQIKFIKSNLLSEINYNPHPKPYVPIHLEENSAYTLIIVTNLPYIPTKRIPYLDPSVKDFEPKIALDGGADGFSLYRKLFQQIQNLRLHPWGVNVSLIVCEIDYTHGNLAVSEALKYFPKFNVEVKTDLRHKQRLLIIS